MCAWSTVPIPILACHGGQSAGLGLGADPGSVINQLCDLEQLYSSLSQMRELDEKSAEVSSNIGILQCHSSMTSLVAVVSTSTHKAQVHV